MSGFPSLLVHLLVGVGFLWAALLVWPGGPRAVVAWWRYADQGEGDSGALGDAIAALVFMTTLVVVIFIVVASKWIYDLIIPFA